ncbi:MAG: hypothetical protein HFE63_05660 [Clostridiales bacterium]|nr:hypothetical protein [Clostridiales bacterium]
MKKILLLLFLITLSLFVGCNNSNTADMTYNPDKYAKIIALDSNGTSEQLQLFSGSAASLYRERSQYYLNIADEADSNVGEKIPITLENRDYRFSWGDEDYIYLMDSDKKALKISLTAPYKITEHKIKSDMFKYWNEFTIFQSMPGYEVLLDKDWSRVIKTDTEIEPLDEILISKGIIDNVARYSVFDDKFNLISEFLVFPYTMPKNAIVIPLEHSFRVYSKQGKLKYESREYDKALMTIDGMVLVVDGGMVKLVDLKGNELATFFEWHDEIELYDMLSRYADPDNAEAGYYFVFSDLKEKMNFAYCYSPKTKEVTKHIIENLINYIPLPD